MMEQNSAENAAIGSEKNLLIGKPLLNLMFRRGFVCCLRFALVGSDDFFNVSMLTMMVLEVSGHKQAGDSGLLAAVGETTITWVLQPCSSPAAFGALFEWEQFILWDAGYSI